jgi:hypothetical protein
MAIRGAGLKRTTRFWWLAGIVVSICILGGITLWSLRAARLPDVTRETTVPLILLSNRNVLLAAWQPEATTVDVGTRNPIATLSASS